MPHDPKTPRFIQMVLAKRLMSPRQIQEAVEIHQQILQRGVKIGLDEVLLRKGYLTAKQLAAINASIGKGRTDWVQGYEVLSKIGQGGMGAVYKARQQSTGRLVAIKILLPSFSNEKNAVKRFLREAKVISRMSHRNVVAGIDAGYQKGVYYCVMEYVEGSTLAKILEGGKRLRWKDALSIMGQIASALAHAEQHGILHRDVKPENIIIASGGIAKLMDLGVAKLIGEGAASPDLTGVGNVMGTPTYMSPEQARGVPQIDIRSDIFSLGLVLYEMLCGRKGFEGGSPIEIMAKRVHESPRYERLVAVEVPASVIAIVKKMTARSRADRYQNAAELFEHLDVALLGRPLSTPAPSRRGR